MEAIRAFWQARNERERSVLLIGGGVTLLLLLYAFLWEPIRADHARLRQAVPALRAQAAQFAADAAEAERLAGTRGAARAAEGGAALVEAAADRAGIRASVRSVEDVAGGRLRVALDPVPYAALVRWLGDVSGSGALGVETLQLARGAEPGVVQVTALVFRSGGGS